MAQHTTVIKDTTVVTVDRDDTIHYDAAVAIKDGRIAAVGPSREIVARFPGAHAVDGSGKVVMPGFANIHTHFTLIIAKGIYEDLSPPHKPPFTSGLAPLPVPELSRDEMIAMVRLAALEAIRSGTTAALEDGSNVENYAQSIADTGLRLLLCEKAWDKAKGNIGDPGPFDVDAALGDECIARTEALHAKWHGALQRPHHRRRVGLGARHVLAGPAAQAARPAGQARYGRDHPPQPDLGRGFGGRKDTQPQADRISRRYRVPERSPDLRPLPLHGAGRGTAARRGADQCRLQRLYRGAPRLEPAGP